MHDIQFPDVAHWVFDNQIGFEGLCRASVLRNIKLVCLCANPSFYDTAREYWTLCIIKTKLLCSLKQSQSRMAYLTFTVLKQRSLMWMANQEFTQPNSPILSDLVAMKEYKWLLFHLEQTVLNSIHWRWSHCKAFSNAFVELFGKIAVNWHNMHSCPHMQIVSVLLFTWNGEFEVERAW